jgi:anti-anti-sigma factor
MMDDASAKLFRRVPGRCTVESVSCAGHVLIMLSGELDFDAAPDVVEALAVAGRTAKVKTVDVDVSGVTYIDAAGLYGLILAQQEATANARTFRLLVGESGPVRTLLNLAELGGSFD